MTATPSPKGVEPPPSDRCLSNVRTMLGTWVASSFDGINRCEYCHRETSDPIEGHDGMCFVSASHFMVRLYDTTLATLTAERDEAQKRAEVAEAENKRMFAGMLAMMNTNQARAQSAAQSTAKIAQDLQNFLREHTSDVVKLEA